MRTHLATLSLMALVLASTTPAAAIDGEVLITQQKAIDGTIPGTDGPGYPITISQPGTYKLGGNLTVNKAGANGIVVTSHDVTIDFNGFRLFGNNTGNVGIISSLNSLTIRNGMISKFKNDGIRGSGPFWIIRNMRLVANGGNGIKGTGDARQWIISNSQIAENTLSGIDTFDVSADGVGALIQNNLVNANGRNGIRMYRAQIEGNMVAGNGTKAVSSGVYLYRGMVLGNTIVDNSSYGLDSGSFSVGFGNNTFSGNADGSAVNATTVHPNLCSAAAC